MFHCLCCCCSAIFFPICIHCRIPANEYNLNHCRSIPCALFNTKTTAQLTNQRANCSSFLTGQCTHLSTMHECKMVKSNIKPKEWSFDISRITTSFNQCKPKPKSKSKTKSLYSSVDYCVCVYLPLGHVPPSIS